MSAAQNGSGFSNVNSSGSQQGSYFKGHRGTSMAMFIQDDIKLMSNLTVNAGLRWELNSGVSANHGGNSSVGAVRGPSNNNWDMTLAKSTKVGGIRKDATLDFRTEFFNVWNHAQYANP